MLCVNIAKFSKESSWLFNRTRSRRPSAACTARTITCRRLPAVEPTTGETHLRHHVSPNGYYRGRKVIKTKND